MTNPAARLSHAEKAAKNEAKAALLVEVASATQKDFLARFELLLNSMENIPAQFCNFSDEPWTAAGIFYEDFTRTLTKAARKEWLSGEAVLSIFEKAMADARGGRAVATFIILEKSGPAGLAWGR